MARSCELGLTLNFINIVNHPPPVCLPSAIKSHR